MFPSVLIANRGEIACRIARTARRLGLRVIAVASEADRGAPHVAAADQVVVIGPAPASESYLAIDRIIAAARATGAAAIHPGYGFLSERAEFAEACAAAGIVFVGPPPSAIRAMGLKDGAKALMDKAGVPVVPGYHGERQEPEFLRQKAYEIGYPVLIKAVAGGGGKGMRRVDKAIEFEAALDAARREAANAFGEPRVLVEKYVANPRHIEIQVFGDQHGNALHLYERDCSAQRRHQKVIEEAPAPGISPEVRARMGAAAVAAAKAVGYVGAGTVEFIADGSRGLRPDGFWFMEMNTRLQVEHPVTEMVTGLDLVEWQFRVAAGEPLPLSEPPPLSGHAIEARLYAEDPDQGFLPSSGRLDLLELPSGPGIRVDTGVAQGSVVSPFYDPMIAKVIAHGADRGEALGRLANALAGTIVAGPKSNLGFLLRLLDHPAVLLGGFDTGLIDRELPHLTGGTVADGAVAAAAELILAAEAGKAPAHQAWSDPWDAEDGFGLGDERVTGLPLEVGGLPRRATVRWTPAGARVTLDGAVPSGTARVAGAGRAYAIEAGRAVEVTLVDQLAREAVDEGAAQGGIKAPMHGKLTAVLVAAGQSVEKGDRLFIVEAMKMEHAVAAPRAGTILDVLAEPGGQVEEGAAIVVLG